MTNTDGPIIYFDGVCNLCNSVVQFIIRHDREGVFRFASLQSKAGEKVRAEVLLSRDTHPVLRTPLPEKGRGVESGEGELSSVILFYKGRYYIKSDVTLQVARILGGWGMLLMAGYILPRFIRDWIYDAVAKRRYKWFGKKDECMIPTPELKTRFLDE